MAYNFNQAAVNALFEVVTDEAKQLGVFQRVNTHEPKSAPGAQLSCSFFLASIKPSSKVSGMNAVAGTVMFTCRIFKSALAANATEFDAIDPALLTAAGRLMAAYSGGFTLGETVLAVDLLGIDGTPLAADALYTEYESKQYRIMQLSIPVIIDNLWTEAP